MNMSMSQTSPSTSVTKPLMTVSLARSTAKVGERGQIVIPKDAREVFGIRPGDTLLILGDEENGILVTKPEVLNDVAQRIFQNLDKERDE